MLSGGHSDWFERASVGQRYRGREAAKNWVEGIHAVGEIKVRNTFMGETHAVAEAELVLKDGISVPYSVIYDVAASKSPHCGSTSLAPLSRSCRHAIFSISFRRELAERLE